MRSALLPALAILLSLPVAAATVSGRADRQMVSWRGRYRKAFMDGWLEGQGGANGPGGANLIP